MVTGSTIIVIVAILPGKSNNIKLFVAVIEWAEELLPDFRTCLLDLSVFDPELITDSRLKMFLLSLKYSRDPDILRKSSRKSYGYQKKFRIAVVVMIT